MGRAESHVSILELVQSQPHFKLPLNNVEPESLMADKEEIIFSGPHVQDSLFMMRCFKNLVLMKEP